MFQDLALDRGIVGESFETSVPWDKCEKLCSNVKAVVRTECQNRGLKRFMVCCRVTQTYDAGACVYFYFAFGDPQKESFDPVHTYEEIENKARDEILASGTKHKNSYSVALFNYLYFNRWLNFSSSWDWKNKSAVVQAKHFVCWCQFV